MGAKCSKCHKDVGCGCNLIMGLCSSCSGTNFIATKDKQQTITASQKETCEITLSHLTMLVDKLTCVLDYRRHEEINETLQNVLNIRNVVSATMLEEDYCKNRPFVQLAEQIVAKINRFTVC